jgi:hypothetical protein
LKSNEALSKSCVLALALDRTPRMFRNLDKEQVLNLNKRWYWVVLFTVTPVAHAQVDTGAISGAVKDASGAVVVSARVKITQSDTGIASSFLTNGVGFYSAP